MQKSTVLFPHMHTCIMANDRFSLLFQNAGFITVRFCKKRDFHHDDALGGKLEARYVVSHIKIYRSPVPPPPKSVYFGQMI